MYRATVGITAGSDERASPCEDVRKAARACTCWILARRLKTTNRTWRGRRRILCRWLWLLGLCFNISSVIQTPTDMLGRNTTSPQQPPASCNGDANGHSDSLMETLYSKCSIDTTVKHLTGLEPSVPIIPPSITGPCVYGHIINDENRDHFRHLYPKVQKWQSSDPEALVSIASLIHHEKGIFAITADVYDQGHWRVCLVHVDCRFPGRVIDERGTRYYRELPWNH